MRLRIPASAMFVALATAILLVPTLVIGSPASAATMKTWNRLAKCESGGRWHINTHNGYYGGLQISGGTWRAYGGKRLASMPHRASKGEQVRIAKKIQKRQGWGAWPSCSRRIGKR
ncbi:transglycosylase family protein [Marmoricola sp. URHB0036]|uniref:transglycosylase family protein n=1 Tax=Marmoricola sp. URHB0036 TaxID=1298863 RepID=UPI0003F5852E|nr:transglycosylase family protein [Marmoricola sp. URHB0036]